MEYLIAFSVWFFFGFILNLFLVSIMQLVSDKKDTILYTAPIVSFFRMAIIVFGIKYFLELGYNDALFSYLVVFDVLYSFLVVLILSKNVNSTNRIAMERTGKNVGSVIFAIVFFFLLK